MILPRSAQELYYLMRDLLEKDLKDIQNNLPLNYMWETTKLKDLIISFYYYRNQKNIAQAAKQIGMSRTALSYYINKNRHIHDAVCDALDEDRRNIMGLNKKNSPFLK